MNLPKLIFSSSSTGTVYLPVMTISWPGYIIAAMKRSRSIGSRAAMLSRFCFVSRSTSSRASAADRGVVFWVAGGAATVRNAMTAKTAGIMGKVLLSTDEQRVFFLVTLEAALGLRGHEGREDAAERGHEHGALAHGAGHDRLNH